ncbi:MAG: sugar phosphate isomerase/epimerase [Nocardioides sp.]|uniref:sugar phosphate isomerase/epimerase family protein n=1 Tax=Nocardioides sp. TaxID=35761 RepID=UPI0039E47CAB
MTSVHSRLSVSGLCFPEMSAEEAVRACGELGVLWTSITSAKASATGAGVLAAAARESGVGVATTTAAIRFDLAPGADNSDRVSAALADVDQAAALGATTVYTLTGPRVFDTWSENAEAYAALAAPVVAHAGAKGVRVALEPTNWLYADLTFVHSFRDAVALATLAGMGVCLDLFHVWTEADLLENIAEHIDLIHHVQVSDMERGARSLPCRTVPGDGDIPLRSLVAHLLAAGYTGPFDLELSGPRIDESGHRAAVLTSLARLESLLDDLGA